MSDRFSRGLNWLVSIVCLVALFAGCVDLSVLAPKEPVTIRFAAFGSEGYYAPFIEEFQKTHKHVTVEVVSLNFRGPNNFDNVDVLLTVPFMLPDLVEDGFPISLNAFVQEDENFDLEGFYPGAVDAFRTQGTIWAIPYVVDTTMMFYNRDLFDKYGVAYPPVDWTWDEFLERARQLSHPDQGEYGFAYQQMGTNEAALLMYQYGGRIVDDLDNPTRTTLNDPNNVIAMQFYADLIHRYGVAPPPGQRPQPYPQRGIEDGQYAMWIDSFSNEYPDVNLGRATLPRAENAMSVGTVLGYVISSETVDPKACWDWVAYITQNTSPGLIPANRKLAESGTFSGIRDEAEMEAVSASLERLTALRLNLQGDFRSQSGAFGQAFMQAVVAIQNGDPVQAALDAAQEKIAP